MKDYPVEDRKFLSEKQKQLIAEISWYDEQIESVKQDLKKLEK